MKKLSGGAERHQHVDRLTGVRWNFPNVVGFKGVGNGVALLLNLPKFEQLALLISFFPLVAPLGLGEQRLQYLIGVFGRAHIKRVYRWRPKQPSQTTHSNQEIANLRHSNAPKTGYRNAKLVIARKY